MNLPDAARTGDDFRDKMLAGVRISEANVPLETATSRQLLMSQLLHAQACKHCVKNIPRDADHPFPRSSSMRSMGWVKFPFAAITFEVGL